MTKKLNKEKNINESFPSSDYLTDNSTYAESEINETTSNLIKLIENHRNRNFFGYEFRFNECYTRIKKEHEETETYSQESYHPFKLTIHQLLLHLIFNLIVELILHFDLFNSSEDTSRLISLIKYRDTILEGFKASKRIQGSQLRAANILKKIAIEKELKFDAKYTETMNLAQLVDHLYVKILMLKKMLARVENDRLRSIEKYGSAESNLKMILSENIHAKEDYILAARKANQHVATVEFSVKELKSDEYIWNHLKSSLV